MGRLVKNKVTAENSPLSASESSKKEQIGSILGQRAFYVLKHGNPYIIYIENFYESKYFIN